MAGGQRQGVPHTRATVRGRELGSVDPFALWGLMLLTSALTGHTSLLYADLKNTPTDQRQLYALLICFIAGCASQFFFLLSRVGVDKPHRPPRWVGEIALGGVAAYVMCAGYLKYGPEVELPMLIVIAALAGFAGQRALVWAIEAALKKAGVKGSMTEAEKDSDTDGP
jgi:ABC-type thiamin/hydroxymethylpyrimidine transport system permease subunit